MPQATSASNGVGFTDTNNFDLSDSNFRSPSLVNTRSWCEIESELQMKFLNDALRDRRVVEIDYQDDNASPVLTHSGVIKRISSNGEQPHLFIESDKVEPDGHTPRYLELKDVIALRMVDSSKTVSYINGVDNLPDLSSLLSQATIDRNGNVKLSGQIGLDPKASSLSLIEGGVEKETKQIFDNIDAIFKEIGITWNDVSRVAVYLKNINQDYAAFNAIYKERLESELFCMPAREVIGADLALGASIEITVDACKPLEK